MHSDDVNISYHDIIKVKMLMFSGDVDIVRVI